MASLLHRSRRDKIVTKLHNSVFFIMACLKNLIFLPFLRHNTVILGLSPTT